MKMMKTLREIIYRYRQAERDRTSLIDRAIDRLVYDLYGLIEDEIKVVEKSVWEEKFEEMYGKLPSRDSALRLAEEVKNEAHKG